MSFCLPCLEGCLVFSGNSTVEARLAIGQEQPVTAPPLTPKSSPIAVFPPGDALARMKELLQAAPPGQEVPDAWVTLDYPKNSKKLLVLLPSPDDPPGYWAKAPTASAGLPTGPRLLRWAERNGYAACIFSAEALKRDPKGAWTRVFLRNPSRSVYVLAAPGAVASFAECVKDEHPLSYSRVRSLVCTESGEADMVISKVEKALPDVADFLKRYATKDLVKEGQTAEALIKVIFDLFAEIENRWQENEYKKLGALAGLKENDVPGLRRVPVDERVTRINRERNDDELSRLCKAAEEVD